MRWGRGCGVRVGGSLSQLAPLDSLGVEGGVGELGRVVPAWS